MYSSERCIAARFSGSSTCAGSGTRPVIGDDILRARAPGDVRRDVGGVEMRLLVVFGARVGGQGPPIGDRLLPGRALRRVGPAHDVGDGLFVGRDKPGAGARFDRHVADRHAAFHRHVAEGAAGIFEDMAGAAGGADLADDREDHVLGADPGAEAAVDLDQHVFGRRLDQGLGGEHVLDLGGADAKGERAHRAVRRGVAVAADDRHAGLAQSLLRPDDVDDALVDAVDREIGDAELLHIALPGCRPAASIPGRRCRGCDRSSAHCGRLPPSSRRAGEPCGRRA